MDELKTLDANILLSPEFQRLAVGAKSLYVFLLLSADKYGFVDNVYRLLGANRYLSGNLEDLCKTGYVILMPDDCVLIADYFLHNRGLLLMDEDRADCYKLTTIVNRRFMSLDKANKVRKVSTFIPPTIEDIRGYIKEKKLKVDPEEFYRYYTTPNSNGAIWVNSTGKPMANWKQTLFTWHRHALSKGGNNGRSTEPNPKPSTKWDIKYDF